MAYKYKLSEMSKTASPEAAEKETGIPKDDQRVGKVTYSKDGDTKFTVTNINPETGQISWKITNLPAFDKLLDDADALISTSKGVYTKTKDDEKFREFYEEARSIRNKIRKHLRNEYPDEYKRIQMFGEAYSGFLRNPEDPDSKPFEPKGAVSEFREELRALFGKFKGDLKNPEFIKGVAQIMVNWKSLLRSQMDEADVDEASMSGAAGAYNTPYAFRKKGSKPNVGALTKLGYKLVKKDKEDINEEKAITFRPGTLDDIELSTRILDKFGIKYKINNYDLILSNDDYLVVLDYLKGGNNVNVNLSNSILNENESPSLNAKTYAEDMMRQYRKMFRIVDGNFGKEAAEEFKNIVKSKMAQLQEGVGASLGPGPKAGPDGVTDSAYTKQFKYKLVPKTKDGTYVQKGSGMVVKKLF